MRKIYWEAETGNVIMDTGWQAQPTTLDQDFEFYIPLNQRVRDTVKVKQLQNGDYEQDFAECSGYRIDPLTEALLFSYPDPNAPEAPPVYQVPLTEQVAELKSQNSEIIFTLVMNDLM